MSPSSHSPDERRSELRIEEETTIFLEVMSDNDNGAPRVVICNSLDMSANGVQIALDEEVPVGCILRLGVELGKDTDALYLVGEAKWVRPDEDQFQIGFELYDAENTDIAAWKQAVADFLNSDRE